MAASGFNGDPMQGVLFFDAWATAMREHLAMQSHRIALSRAAAEPPEPPEPLPTPKAGLSGLPGFPPPFGGGVEEPSPPAAPPTRPEPKRKGFQGPGIEAPPFAEEANKLSEPPPALFHGTLNGRGSSVPGPMTAPLEETSPEEELEAPEPVPNPHLDPSDFQEVKGDPSLTEEDILLDTAPGMESHEAEDSSGSSTAEEVGETETKETENT